MMKNPRRTAWIASTFASLVLAGAGQARAEQQLITNGGFEANDGVNTRVFAGWTIANRLSSTDYDGNTVAQGGDPQGSFYVQGTSGTPPVSGPLTGGAALQPHSGSSYALSDSTAPGVHALLQSFNAPAGASSLMLSFALWTYDYYGDGATGGTSLDYTGGPNQHVQVDLLTASATPFATDSASVVRNLYAGEIPNPAGSNPPAWQTFNYDLTGLHLAGTYQIRFSEVDNQFTLNMGVDDVSILATVPEPSSLLLVASGGVAIALHQRRRRRERG